MLRRFLAFATLLLSGTPALAAEGLAVSANQAVIGLGAVALAGGAIAGAVLFSPHARRRRALKAMRRSRMSRAAKRPAQVAPAAFLQPADHTAVAGAAAAAPVSGEKLVASVIAMAGGKIVGRIRLQKTIYLLDRLGMGSGLAFAYVRHGPYSRALDRALDHAKSAGAVEERTELRHSDAAPYSIFVSEAPAVDGAFGRIEPRQAAWLLQRLARVSGVVLELAATIDWLWREEGVEDWRGEISRRKGLKALESHVDKALGVLGELGLEPPERQAPPARDSRDRRPATIPGEQASEAEPAAAGKLSA